MARQTNVHISSILVDRMGPQRTSVPRVGRRYHTRPIPNSLTACRRKRKFVYHAFRTILSCALDFPSVTSGGVALYYISSTLRCAITKYINSSASAICFVTMELLVNVETRRCRALVYNFKNFVSLFLVADNG